jgi:putative membrane protein
MAVTGNQLALLLPYEFSPTVAVVCGVTGWLYVLGGRDKSTHFRQLIMFWLGMLLLYGVLQTQFDLYAQHMFFLHRLQHLILHHLAPFLIALSMPLERLQNGITKVLGHTLNKPLVNLGLLQAVYRTVQQPVIAALLFVGLIYLWLIPEVHFIAMLNLPLYNTMNWGMALDGLLFWWMVFNMRAAGVTTTRHYGGRILLLFLLMVPQIVIGAYIALSNEDLYAVYAVCGRAWPLSALLDQQIGGLLTWIPAAMMSIAGMLVLLRRWLQERDVVSAGGVVWREFA